MRTQMGGPTTRMGGVGNPSNVLGVDANQGGRPMVDGRPLPRGTSSLEGVRCWLKGAGDRGGETTDQMLRGCAISVNDS